jgi:hypothetical protein
MTQIRMATTKRRRRKPKPRTQKQRTPNLAPALPLPLLLPRLPLRLLPPLPRPLRPALEPTRLPPATPALRPITQAPCSPAHVHLTATRPAHHPMGMACAFGAVVLPLSVSNCLSLSLCTRYPPMMGRGAPPAFPPYGAPPAYGMPPYGMMPYGYPVGTSLGHCDAPRFGLTYLPFPV